MYIQNVEDTIKKKKSLVIPRNRKISKMNEKRQSEMPRS